MFKRLLIAAALLAAVAAPAMAQKQKQGVDERALFNFVERVRLKAAAEVSSNTAVAPPPECFQDFSGYGIDNGTVCITTSFVTPTGAGYGDFAKPLPDCKITLRDLSVVKSDPVTLVFAYDTAVSGGFASCIEIAGQWVALQGAPQWTKLVVTVKYGRPKRTWMDNYEGEFAQTLFLPPAK